MGMTSDADEVLTSLVISSKGGRVAQLSFPLLPHRFAVNVVGRLYSAVDEALDHLVADTCCCDIQLHMNTSKREDARGECMR